MQFKTNNHFNYMYRFMQLQARNLADIFIRNGIKDIDLIKNMTESYLASFAMDLDSGVIKDEQLGDLELCPSVVFLDKSICQKPDVIIISDGDDDFHETMPYGVADDLADMLRDGTEFGFKYNNQKI